MKKHNLCNLIVVLLLIVGSLFSACSNSRKLTYFSSMKRDSAIYVQAQNLQSVISKNDILQISISTLDETTTRNLNAVAGAGAGSTGGTAAGYQLDEAGMIKLPLLGAIKAEGYTKGQLESIITNQILEKKIAKEPVVIVRISNYRITILGEVGRPVVIQLPQERITLFEALGQAGDLTQFGRRDSVLLIREENGKINRKYFSLTKGDAFNPEVYNLKNKDVIYVLPSNERTQAQDRSIQYASLGLSTVSLLVLLYVQLIR